MTASVILILGSRRESAPVGLTGLLTGNAFETFPAAVNAPDPADDDRELIERFARFCDDRATRCVWLRRMADAHLTTEFTASGSRLRLRGLPELEEHELRQEAIAGVWYRGLPAVPAFASEDDQAYAERETEAFWEGYCRHAPTAVLNRPRTAGLRPATWEKFLLRHHVSGVLDLPTPREGLAGPRAALPGSRLPRACETLSSRRTLHAEEAAAEAEQFAWLEDMPPTRSPVLAVHVGREVLFARPRHDGGTEPLPAALPAALAAALVAATRGVARLLDEEFGASLWEIDVREGRFLFRDFTPNPAARTLLALESHLFPSIWRFLTRVGGEG